MKVLVLGANGATGVLAVKHLLQRGHEVTAFTRRRAQMGEAKTVLGNVLDSASVERAVQGQDAVVVTLGIRENPLAVRLRGSRNTAMDVRSRGTQHAVDAMKKLGVRRLVVQTTYGVAETWPRLSWMWKAIFALILKPQIRDTELQEDVVRRSGLEWTLARPVGLTDSLADQQLSASPNGEVEGMQVSRDSVARFLADAVEDARYARQAVSLSSRPRLD
ncbi:MAG: NAD(P)-binding oxidoreductase [Bryobacteraceae bacterium]